MKRIITILTVALVMAAMMLASVMPAFAQGQGPEGGNPGQGNPKQQSKGTAGESGNQPLPFGGEEPEAGLNNAPRGVVCTAPGSPFYNPDAPPCQE